MLLFNAAGLLRALWTAAVQGFLPLNPQGLGGVAPDLAFNTAASFATNTNWQAYGGETTLSYLTQMVGLTVQNFVSAATGHGDPGRVDQGLGATQRADHRQLLADLTRTTLYILLPLSAILSVLFVSQGVVQTFNAYQTATLLQTAQLRQTLGGCERPAGAG